FENRIAPYYAMVQLLITEDDRAAALSFAERSKARTLVDVLRSGKTETSTVLTAGERAREQQLNFKLGSLNSMLVAEEKRNAPDAGRLSELKVDLEKTRLDFESFQINLYSAHPQLRTQRAEFEPITLSQCASLIPDSKTALMEFLV